MDEQSGNTMGGKTESILLAGLAIGVVASLLEAIPGASGCLTCAVYLGSGVLGVWHYANTYAVTVPAGTGAGIGAAAGLVSAIVSGIIDFVIARLGARPSLREQLEEGMAALEESGMSMEQIDQIRVWFSSPSFLVTAIIFGLIVISGLGALGGTIGAGVFRKGEAEEEV